MENLEFTIQVTTQVATIGRHITFFSMFVPILIFMVFSKLPALVENIPETPAKKFFFAEDKRWEGIKPSVVAAIAAAIYAAEENRNMYFININVIKPMRELHPAVNAWVRQGREDLLNTDKRMEPLRRNKRGRKNF